MGRIANKNRKKIYVTDDNPRDEDHRKIIKEIIKHKSSNCFNIGNGQKLLKQQFNAEPNEIIL